MAGPAQVLRPGSRVHTFAAGVAPLLGGDAGGGVHVVDGDSECGAVVVGIYLYHLLQPQTGSHFLAHGGADEPLGVDGHKIHILRGGKLSRTDKVPLVFPVGVVNGDDEVARPQFFQGFLHGAIGMFHG